MSVHILDVANGVADALAEYNAEVVYAPSFELKRMQDMRVVVVPVEKERKFASRLAYDNINSVDIGIIHKCREASAVPELISLVESIGEGLLNHSIGNSVCVRVSWEPVFSVDELKTKGVFISVIKASYKELS